MSVDYGIARLTSDPDGLDFAGLRKTGIDLLQALCGEGWTDYNLHDPGVTLLELLCYGLTDLVYRSELGVADYLSDQDGGIDFQQHALFLPQQILPCAPCTLLDYRKLLYDQIPAIDDVWLRMVEDSQQPAGLLVVYVKPHDGRPNEVPTRGEGVAGGGADSDLVQQVRITLAAHRNCAEDLHEVHVVQTQPYMLEGEIEIDDSRSIADLYAEIVFSCSRQFSSVGRMTRFEEAIAEGRDCEQLLTGPLTEHGFLDDKDFLRTSYRIDVINLISMIRKIPGVVSVRRLRMRDAGGKALESVLCDPGKNLFPVLQFPGNVEEMQYLRLVYGRTPATSEFAVREAGSRSASLQDEAQLDLVRLSLKKRDFEHQAFRRNQGNLDQLIGMPTGSPCFLHEYFSISEHAPNIYGINSFGVPPSEPPAVHARAWQLKAYLYPFEQLMANYLQCLQNTSMLYSLKPDLRQSYFSQALGNNEVPGLETLYGLPTAEKSQAQRVQQVISHFDPYQGRRNRVLDYLLALYGETFPSESLSRFNSYHQQDPGQWLIDCKVAYLNQLRQLSARRGAAFNYCKPYLTGDNYSPLQFKLMLLSGCDVKNAIGSMVAHLSGPGHNFVTGERYRETLRVIDVDDSRADGASTDVTNKAIRLPYRMLCSEVMQAGCEKNNYHILKVAEGKVHLCLQISGESQAWPMLLLPAADADRAILQMVTQLMDLSRRAEGMHIIEHILLRPRGSAIADPSVFGCRASIVLPNYGARFSNPAFHLWMAELVSQHFPAHILTQLYWLDYFQFSLFEVLHNRWLELLARWSECEAPTADLTGELDQAAKGLLEFIETSPCTLSGYRGQWF